MFKETEHEGCTLLVFPHPSGVSHFWNKPDQVKQAATQFQQHIASSNLRAPIHQPVPKQRGYKHKDHFCHESKRMLKRRKTEKGQ
jgi:hypothetical protein